MKNLTSILPAMLIALLSLTACQHETLDVQPLFVTERGGALPEETALYYSADMRLNEKPISEWTKEWWKYVLSFNCAQNPLNYSHLYEEIPQRGPVAFLVGSKNGHAVKTINIYQRQSLLLPVMNTLSKYPRPSSREIVAPENLFKYLYKEADWYIDQVTNMKVTLDGQLIRISNSNRVHTEIFNIQGKEDLAACIDYDITGQKQAALSDGYWLVLRHLPKGLHTLKIHAEILQTGVVIEGSYTINVL